VGDEGLRQDVVLHAVVTAVVDGTDVASIAVTVAENSTAGNTTDEDGTSLCHSILEMDIPVSTIKGSSISVAFDSTL